MITNDVSDYVNLLARISHIICNHPYFLIVYCSNLWNDTTSRSINIVLWPIGRLEVSVVWLQC